MADESSTMFARMLDRREIIDFVKEIEKYPYLYDQNSFQYANKVLKRRTWLDIATKYKTNVHDCKEKWRKIRIAYLRSMKLSKSGNPPSRPYYLADYLHFISPEKKTDDNIPTTNSPASPVLSEDSLKLEIDEYDHLVNSERLDGQDMSEEQLDEQQEGEDTIVKREGYSRVQDGQYSRGIHSSSSNMKELREENSRLQAEIVREVCSRRNDVHPETQKSFIDDSSPRRMFLLSLLPDIEILSEQEMRTFRREVINLLDNIITTRESVIKNLSFSNKYI